MKLHSRHSVGRLGSLLGLGLTVPLVVAACGVPGSGDAVVVEEVVHNGADDSPGVVATPPRPTTDAVETVSNFLRAAAGDINSRDDRLNQFVNEGVDWSDPNVGIQIVRLNDSPVVSSTDADGVVEASVVATGTIVGTYGQQGQVVQATGDTQYEVEFSLQRETPNSRWKLVEPPPQVTIDDEAFDDFYEARPLYFPGRGGDNVLVPDLRWVVRSYGDAAPRYAQVTDWLMQGPSDWIASTVSSAFPSGMARRGSIDVDDDHVTVDVSTENTTGKADQYRTMAAQLAWSLGLSEDTRLTLLVDGQERVSETVRTWSSRNRAPAAGNSANRDVAYYVSDAVVHSNERDAAFAGETAPGLRQPVLEPRGSRLAAVVDGENGAQLLVGQAGTLERIPDFAAASLTDPQWIDRDRLLVIADGRLVVVTIRTGEAQPVADTALGDSPHRLAMAPDARRLAYVSDNQAYVVPVAHTDDAASPLTFGEPRRVGADIDAVVDVGWSQETQLLIIGEVKDSQVWLWYSTIDNGVEGTMDSATISTIAKADELAVRCQPPKRAGTVGQPILVEIDGAILRVYPNEVEQLDAPNGDGAIVEANGYDPFVLG